MRNGLSRKEAGGSRLRLSVLLAAVLVAGGICVWWLAILADREKREDLLIQTHLVAAALNVDKVKALSGALTDLSSPEYLRLKEQLFGIRAANPDCRFVYLTGRRPDGSIFFYVDSEPAGSKDESPPGQIYEEAPKGFYRVFDTQMSVVEGPVTDRWGVWVSGMVPLLDPKTGKLIAVLAMDIDARDWKWTVAAQAALPVGLVLTAMMLMAAILMLARTNAHVRSQHAELLESKERLAATLRSIGDGVIACDRDGRVTSLNRAAEALTGWLSLVAEGRPLREVFCIVDARTGEAVENPVTRTLAEGVSVELADSVFLLSRSGDQYRIADSCAPVHDASGAVTGAVLVFRDVTEEYRRVEELREERDRIDHILNITGTRIDIVDGDFNLHFVDKNWQKVYGDPAGRKCHEYFNGLSEPCPGCGIPRALESKEIVVTEEQLPKENNRTIEVHIIPFRNAAGDWLVAEFNLDITERKRAEAEREKLREQLQQAMKMEAVGRLAGGVAHDFNNMLAGILGYTEMALDRLDPADPLHADLEEVMKAARRSAEITSQLLAFSRKQLIEPKVLNLNDLLANMHKMLERLIGEDIELKTIAGPDLGAVKVDPGQFDQILVNLAVNARDAMPDGGALTIETANVELDDAQGPDHPQVQPGPYVRMTVSDTGCGMTAEAKAHLFEPFFTTKEKGKGTGLGLATVYGAVNQSGGNIEVESEPGKGTIFRIYFPRVEEKVEKAVQKSHALEMPDGDETILLVEDEEIVRNLAVRILVRLGYHVLPAGSGKDALALAGQFTGPIHLLLTDVVMPGMNGRVLAERMAEIYPEIKVLYTSGYTEDVIAHHGVVEADLHFIGKPYSPWDLAEKVRKVLGRKKNHPQ